MATKRRHTHFTIDQLIDAGVSGEVIELYRALIAEASGRKTSVAKSGRRAKSNESDLLPGAVSRLDSFVPDRFAQIEHLYGELLAQTEARHKAEMEKLSAHLAYGTQARRTHLRTRSAKSKENSLPTSLTRKRHTRRKSRNSLPTSRTRKRNTRPKLRNSPPIWLKQKSTT